MEFQLSGSDAVLLRKAPAREQDPRTRSERVHARTEAQVRRRAQELLALLRGLA